MTLGTVRRIFGICIFLWIGYAAITWLFFKNISPTSVATVAATILIIAIDRFFDYLQERRNRT